MTASSIPAPSPAECLVRRSYGEAINHRDLGTAVTALLDSFSDLTMTS